MYIHVFIFLFTVIIIIRLIIIIHASFLVGLLYFMQPTMTGANRTVVHDIPVALVPERLWPDYQEPDMPEIDVS